MPDHPPPLGTALARILVPASRRDTAWRGPVNNILAAIALSSWHPSNTDPDTSPSPSTAPDATGHAEPVQTAVRVLDIDTTSPLKNSSTTTRTANRQPHLRRGHWRHQRVGLHRRDTRWTWVRPTTVNLSSSSLSIQIYRLPTMPMPMLMSCTPTLGSSDP